MLRSLAFLLPLAVVAAEFPFDAQKITVPDGFIVEQVAAPPLVDRPVEADFDEQGRLYVTDVTGTNDKVEKQLADAPHRVLRLVDSDGDGRFDKRTVFADKLGFPEGCLWHDGSLYVAAPPHIWKFTDGDGDGVAEKRELWFDAKTLTHCANDLHGPYLGPDGWIYWCKGAFAEQTYTLADGREWKTTASHIFRRRPEGGPVEPVLTGGMDNPVGVAFAASGERFLSCTFFQHPANGQRDGLIHAIYGGVYGKQTDRIGGHPRTSPELMPVLTHLSAAAACGLTRLESDALGLRDQLLACSFNLKRVSRHELVPAGASFTTKDADFLASDSTDFHPTDVLEDADGSVLIVDTGGWYKICCPTSQLQKPDVLGAIYRVRRKDAPKASDPRGLALDWAKATPAQLATRLGDARHVVRQRAQLALGKAGDAAIAPLSAILEKDKDAQTRAAAVWALARIATPSARDATRFALADRDPLVLQAALHSVSAWRDRGAAEHAVNLLGSGSLPVRRTAAEALGRIGSAATAPRLLRTDAGKDRILEHSLTFALIELAQPVAPTTSRALIALDQMPGARLKAADVIPHLSSADAPLRDAARWIASRHPEWSAGIVAWLRDAVTRQEILRDEAEPLLLAQATAAAGQELLAEWGAAGGDEVRRLLAIRVMARAAVTTAPRGWPEAIASAIGHHRPLQDHAIAAAQALRDRKIKSPLIDNTLHSLATRPGIPPETCVAALSAMSDPIPAVDDGTFQVLRSAFATGQPMFHRRATVAVLRRMSITAPQWAALAAIVPGIEPAALADLIPVFDRCSDAAAGRDLLAALRSAKGVANLPADTLRKAFAKQPEAMREEAAALSANQGIDPAKQRARLDELAASLKTGDVRRGQEVFRSLKSACTACHAMGYLGGNIGPDLTRIGKIRTERDLIEAIVYPSASFVRSYEPMLVHTQSGDLLGIVRAENADELVLAVGPGAEMRVPRAETRGVDPAPTSLMPIGYDGILTPQEIADLVVFLKASI